MLGAWQVARRTRARPRKKTAFKGPGRLRHRGRLRVLLQRLGACAYSRSVARLQDGIVTDPDSSRLQRPGGGAAPRHRALRRRRRRRRRRRDRGDLRGADRAASPGDRGPAAARSTRWRRSITIVNGGILGAVDEDAFHGCSRLSVPRLRRVRRTSPSFATSHRLTSTGSRRPRSRSSAASMPVIPTCTGSSSPDSLDDILRSCSKNTRKPAALRTQARKTYEGQLVVRRYTRPEDIDDFFHDVEEVAPKTYQHAFGLALHDTPAHRSGRSYTERGRFRRLRARAGGTPVPAPLGRALPRTVSPRPTGLRSGPGAPQGWHLPAPASAR